MARRTTTSALQRTRRALLVGLLLFVGTLVTLYMFGRRSSPLVAPADREQAPGGSIVQVGLGFRREVSEDGKRLFDIEADRVLSDESGLYILEGVKVGMVRDNGTEITIKAERGSYALALNEAALEGEVELSSSDGLVLKTAGLELARNGKVVISSSPVEISSTDGYRGRANKLEYLFPQNRLLMAGKVELSTVGRASPRSTLRARRIVFFRDSHNFLAEGNVELRTGEDLLRARRLSIDMDDDDRRIRFVNASWNVDAVLHQIGDDGLPSVARLSGDALALTFDPETGEAQRIEIDAPEGGLAELQVADATGLQRTMRADYLWAEFDGGHLRQAEGLGGVTIIENLEFAPRVIIRQLCSDSARAAYDASGEPTDLTLAGNVSYQDADLQAGGDELTTGDDAQTIDLIGDKAWLANSDGRLEAPQIHIDQAAGSAQALGGVRVEMAETSGPALAGESETEEPVRIEAGLATWTSDPQNFQFENNVRAWQGENFLVAEKLAMADGELVADGGMRSVWHQRTKAAVELDGEQQPPITIAANTMRYKREERRMVYEGAAQIAHGARSMSCPLLQLEMNEDDDFERMYCEGGSRIADGDGGSTISGDVAIYNTAAGKMKILGDPVKLTQATGGTISARVMVYDFETSIAEIDSVKDEDAQLFMSSSEYFKQFAPRPTLPLVAPGTEIGPPGTEIGSGVEAGLEPTAADASALATSDPAADASVTEETVIEEQSTADSVDSIEPPAAEGGA